jgi:hypothetical protein
MTKLLIGIAAGFSVAVVLALITVSYPKSAVAQACMCVVDAVTEANTGIIAPA